MINISIWLRLGTIWILLKSTPMLRSGKLWNAPVWKTEWRCCPSNSTPWSLRMGTISPLVKGSSCAWPGPFFVTARFLDRFCNSSLGMIQRWMISDPSSGWGDGGHRYADGCHHPSHTAASLQRVHHTYNSSSVEYGHSLWSHCRSSRRKSMHNSWPLIFYIDSLQFSFCVRWKSLTNLAFYLPIPSQPSPTWWQRQISPLPQLSVPDCSAKTPNRIIFDIIQMRLLLFTFFWLEIFYPVSCAFSPSTDTFRGLYLSG